MPVLIGLGYEYGGLILNSPGRRRTPQLKSEDLVVLTTRPPLDDPHSEGERRRISQSGTPLEKRILKAARGSFATCKRSIIKLSPDAASRLAPRFANRGWMEFRVYSREEPAPSYSGYHNPYGRTRKARQHHKPADPNATATFLLITPLQGGGTLINAFGMNGVTTLIWCYLLRTRFPHLLQTNGLTMAEIIMRPLPDLPPDLAFAERWRVDLLLSP